MRIGTAAHSVLYPQSKNRGGCPPLLLLNVWTGDYESANAAIETDSAVSQANVVWNWTSELSVLNSEP